MGAPPHGKHALATDISGQMIKIASKTKPLTNLLRLAILLACAFWSWEREYPSAVVPAICIALTYLPRTFSLNASTRGWSELGITCYLSLHVFLGMGLGLYEWETGFDKVLHALGFGAFTAIFVRGLPRLANAHGLIAPPRLVIAVAVVIALGGGAAWEILEYSIDRTGWFNSQRGLDDTMLDLVANAVGALVTAVAVILSRSRSTRFIT